MAPAVRLVGGTVDGSVRIYQTNAGGDDVHVIDAAANKVVFQVKDIEIPHGVVVP
ncbi:MAG TPA: hypothetical protein VNV82_13230 [Bryobacteraceae bacterium]|jgi:YVTN family beta-propeller protein|nr:hypothetical protein [Bryobacteraceae bacterium]